MVALSLFRMDSRGTFSKFFDFVNIILYRLGLNSSKALGRIVFELSDNLLSFWATTEVLALTLGISDYAGYLLDRLALFARIDCELLVKTEIDYLSRLFIFYNFCLSFHQKIIISKFIFFLHTKSLSKRVCSSPQMIKLYL